MLPWTLAPLALADPTPVERQVLVVSGPVATPLPLRVDPGYPRPFDASLVALGACAVPADAAILLDLAKVAFPGAALRAATWPDEACSAAAAGKVRTDPPAAQVPLVAGAPLRFEVWVDHPEVPDAMAQLDLRLVHQSGRVLDQLELRPVCEDWHDSYTEGGIRSGRSGLQPRFHRPARRAGLAVQHAEMGTDTSGYTKTSLVGWRCGHLVQVAEQKVDRTSPTQPPPTTAYAATPDGIRATVWAGDPLKTKGKTQVYVWSADGCSLAPKP